MTNSANRNQFYSDIIITAIEGGVNYWAEVSQYINPVVDGIEPKNTYAVIHEIEPNGAPNSFPVNLDVVKRGVDKILGEQVSVSQRLSYCVNKGYEANDAGYLDADAADVIVQVGLFGEVVYG